MCFHIIIVDGWKTILESGKRSSGALVVAPRRSTHNPRTLLFLCKKWWWTHATSHKEGRPEAQVKEQHLGRKNGQQTEL